MEITFLRPELEELHRDVNDLFALEGAEVEVGAFAHAREYAAAGDDMFAAEPPYLDLLLSYLAQHAPPPATVLDVGPAPGAWRSPLPRPATM